jgi:acyl transferase domain-containing protein
MSRVVMVLPGAGGYGRASLNSLPPNDPRVTQADAFRRDAGLPTLRELDGAGVFEPSLHGQAIHALPLAYLIGVIQADIAQRDHRPIAVLGSGNGWQTALVVAGVLSFGDGLRLVHELAYAEQQSPSAALIYPLTDAAWRPQPALRAALDAALGAVVGEATGLLDLGAFVVVGGPPDAIGRLLPKLRPVQIGEQRYPQRVAGTRLHGVTPLPEASVEHLAALDWRRPSVTLIDGRGARHTPWAADPTELRAYTLGALRAEPYRFAAGLRVALREYAPDGLLLLGPGRSLANGVAQALVAEGYRGVRSRTAFEALQRSTSPLLLGTGR